MLVNQTFLHKNRSRRYKHLVINGDKTFFTNEETAGKKYDETLICQMIGFLIDNIYSKIKADFLSWQNYSQPYFFKRNQSSDNRSHGFGAKFLLKKLSASDFSYERKSALSKHLFRQSPWVETVPHS